MKRYLLFTFIDYEAGGGWNDLVAEADDIEDLKKGIYYKKYDDGSGSSLYVQFKDLYGQTGRPDYVQIIDTQTGQVVFTERDVPKDVKE